MVGLQDACFWFDGGASPEDQPSHIVKNRSFQKLVVKSSNLVRRVHRKYGLPVLESLETKHGCLFQWGNLSANAPKAPARHGYTIIVRSEPYMPDAYLGMILRQVLNMMTLDNRLLKLDSRLLTLQGCHLKVPLRNLFLKVVLQKHVPPTLSDAVVPVLQCTSNSDQLHRGLYVKGSLY